VVYSLLSDSWDSSPKRSLGRHFATIIRTFGVRRQLQRMVQPTAMNYVGGAVKAKKKK
jgi:hypothetical protein